jgi:hypothetical protein
MKAMIATHTWKYRYSLSRYAIPIKPSPTINAIKHWPFFAIHSQIMRHLSGGPPAAIQSLGKGLSMNKGYILLLAATRRGAAAGGQLLCCRSSTMTPHRLHRVASQLPARRARQNATFIH